MSLKLSGCFHCAFLSHSWHISDWETRLASEGTFRHHTRNRYYTRMNDCIFYNCMIYITCIFSVWMSSKKPQRHCVMFLSMIYQRSRKQSQSMSPQLVLTYGTVVLNNMYITSWGNQLLKLISYTLAWIFNKALSSNCSFLFLIFFLIKLRYLSQSGFFFFWV